MAEETRVENLSCALTDDELAQRREQVRALRAASKQVDFEQRSAMRTTTHLEREIEEGSTWRDVEIGEQANYEAGTMETVRLDTGDVLRRRPLTRVEREAEPLPGSGPL